MEIAVDASGRIFQHGVGIGVPEGCTLVQLDAEQEAAVLAALEQPSGGLTFADGMVAPLPAPEPVQAGNPNQPLIDAIQQATDVDSLKANMLAVLQPSAGVTAQPAIMVAQATG
jgi:hypothetical protein